MPRKPRMYLPDLPFHIVQRGNNRDATFFAEQDYQFYLECLYDASIRYGVDIHAYVLMTNHVHLLMTPELETSISLVMQPTIVDMCSMLIRNIEEQARYGRGGIRKVWSMRITIY